MNRENQPPHSLKRKHEDQKSEKQDGSFSESCLPDHVCALGNNIFVICSTFLNKLIIHIRKYKKFGEKYYPSVIGITITPEQYQLLASSKLPSTMLDIVHLNLLLDGSNPSKGKTFYISMEDENTFCLQTEYRKSNGHLCKQIISIDSTQWNSLNETMDKIIMSILKQKFGNVNFKNLFKSISNLEVNTNPPDYDDYDYCAAWDLMKDFLKDAVKRKTIFKSEKNCSDKSIDCTVPTERDYNISLLSLKVEDVIEDFQKTLKSHKSIWGETVKFLTDDFLKSVNILNIMENVRKDYFEKDCSSVF